LAAWATYTTTGATLWCCRYGWRHVLYVEAGEQKYTTKSNRAGGARQQYITPNGLRWLLYDRYSDYNPSPNTLFSQAINGDSVALSAVWYMCRVPVAQLNKVIKAAKPSQLKHVDEDELFTWRPVETISADGSKSAVRGFWRPSSEHRFLVQFVTRQSTTRCPS